MRNFLFLHSSWLTSAWRMILIIICYQSSVLSLVANHEFSLPNLLRRIRNDAGLRLLLRYCRTVRVVWRRWNVSDGNATLLLLFLFLSTESDSIWTKLVKSFHGGQKNSTYPTTIQNSKKIAIVAIDWQGMRYLNELCEGCTREEYQSASLLALTACRQLSSHLVRGINKRYSAMSTRTVIIRDKNVRSNALSGEFMKIYLFHIFRRTFTSVSSTLIILCISPTLDDPACVRGLSNMYSQWRYCSYGRTTRLETDHKCLFVHQQIKTWGKTAVVFESSTTILSISERYENPTFFLSEVYE